MHAIQTTIEDVTVYAGAARVRRSGAVEVAGEPVQVRIGGLPLAMKDASVRLGATGPLVAADARVVLEIPDADAALPPADPQALEDARRGLALAEAELARLDRALAALAALTPGPRPDREDPLPDWGAAADARLELLALRGDRERALRAERATARKAADQARRTLDRAEDAHRRATTARQARQDELRKAVIVTLRPTGDGGAGAVSIEYVVPGARWAPTYVARFTDGNARLELRAVIAQETGEDWRGVRLALSTAAAQAWTELPELPSLRIGRRQAPPPRAGWKAPPTGAELLYADWDRTFAGKIAPPPQPRPELTVEAKPEEQQPDTDVLFSLPMAGPAPMPEMARLAPQSKKGGGLGMIGGLVAAPAALLAAGAGAAARGMKSIMADKEQPRAHSNAREEAPAELVAPADLLAYGDLRMPPASAPDRGRLVPADRRDLYLAVLAQQQVVLSFDVLAVIAETERRAQLASNRASPPGTTASWSDAYDYAFPADGAVDVPSDGGWHGLALGVADAPVRVRHVVVPRESSDVFRIARLDSPHDAPLLPGPMDVYDGRDFLLTTSVAFTPPRGHVELGLGVDQRVKVARNATYREETAGMLRGSLRLEHQVEIEVENLTGRAIEVEVRERLPVRAVDDDDDVDIAIERVQPPWQAWTPEPEHPGERRLRGGHRWELALEPDAKQKLELQYHLKIASKHELVGGNRREQ